MSILLRCMSRKSWTSGPTTHEFCKRHGGLGCSRLSMIYGRCDGLTSEFLQGFFLALLLSERARRR